MKRKFLYGGKPAEVESAAGIRGVLRRLFDNTFAFRVYDEDGHFTDYDIQHDDLSITIDADELAAFYAVGKQKVLDHSPQVIGLKEVQPGSTRPFAVAPRAPTVDPDRV